MQISVAYLMNSTNLLRTWPGGELDIFYAGCPILWKSKLLPEITLSTTESKIITLSATLKVVIPLMEITMEMKECRYQILSTQPHVHCRVFEDNSGTLELASTLKY